MILTEDMYEKFEETINKNTNPVEYVSLDPGRSNGLCGYDAKYYLIFMYTVPAADMIKVLEMFKKVKKCILEDFLLFPNKAQKQIYSDMETSRVIGRTEAWAERHNVEIIKQGSRIKPTGYAWIGQKPLPKSNPHNHELDAHVHFMYWAVKNHLINAGDLLKRTM